MNRGHLQQRRPLTPSNRAESKTDEPGVLFILYDWKTILSSNVLKAIYMG